MPVKSSMISWLDKAQCYLFARKWDRSSIGQILARHTNDYFINTNLKHLSQQGKEKLIGGFYNSLFVDIPAAPNPFLKFREALAAVVASYADLQVLCLKPEEKARSFFSSARYISAELHNHIRTCVPHNEELKETLWEMPDYTDNEFIQWANTRCCVYLYYMNGYNILRGEFGEPEGPHPTKDWFRPFIVSSMIFSESTYRQKIGLPQLNDDCVHGIKHNVLAVAVAAGERNPLYRWETDFKVVHSEDI
jgi:hypothetical protein